MAQITFNITAAALARVQALTDRWNSDHGTTLTARDYAMQQLRATLRGASEALATESTLQSIQAAASTDIDGIT